MCLILWFRGSGSFDCGFGISDFGLKRPDGADTGYGLVPIVLVVVLVLVPRLPQILIHEYEYEKSQIRSRAYALRPFFTQSHLSLCFALRLFFFSPFRIPTSEFLTTYTFTMRWSQEKRANVRFFIDTFWGDL